MSNIRSHIRAFRSIPRGSILWFEIDGQLHSPDEIDQNLLHKLKNDRDIFTIHLDTPDGDFENTFELPVEALNVAEEKSRAKGSTYRQLVIAEQGNDEVIRVEKLVNDYALECTSYFQSLFTIKLSEMTIKTRWHFGRSTGGKNGISVGVGYLYASRYSFRYRFEEYAAISKDEDIGDFWSGDRTDHVKALVCHEAAHFIQAHTRGSNLPSYDYRKPHGNGWRFIYRVLRQKLNTEMTDKW